LKLASPVTNLTKLVHHVCLPRKSGDLPDLTSDSVPVLTGWGQRQGEEGSGCGYAWRDPRDGKWLHTPPKMLRDGKKTKLLNFLNFIVIFGFQF